MEHVGRHRTISSLRVPARIISTTCTLAAAGAGAGTGGLACGDWPGALWDGRAGAPTSDARRTPAVGVVSASSGLRSVNVMLPCIDARLIRSASDGATRSVTTV